MVTVNVTSRTLYKGSPEHSASALRFVSVLPEVSHFANVIVSAPSVPSYKISTGNSELGPPKDGSSSYVTATARAKPGQAGSNVHVSRYELISMVSDAVFHATRDGILSLRAYCTAAVCVIAATQSCTS